MATEQKEETIDQLIDRKTEKFLKREDGDKINSNIEHLEKHLHELSHDKPEVNPPEKKETPKEKKHEHATHSSDKVCKDCGEPNPDYDEKQAVCEDCGGEVGTVKEIQDGKIKHCRHCGKDEFMSSELGYTL